MKQSGRIGVHIVKTRLLFWLVLVLFGLSLSNGSEILAMLEDSANGTQEEDIYTDDEYGLSFRYPEQWQLEVSYPGMSEKPAPGVITKRIALSWAETSSQIRVDIYRNHPNLVLEDWFQTYERPLHPDDAIVYDESDVRIAGLPGIWIHDPMNQEEARYARTTILVAHEDTIVALDYYMNDNGQQLPTFLDIASSVQFPDHSSADTRLPELQFLESDQVVLQASSCCGWYDANSNTYPCNGGNCTWWAKYKRPDIGNYWGDAWMWRDRARRENFGVGYTARAGAVVVFQKGVQGSSSWGGHVGYVTAVEAQGRFRYSDMGWKRGCHVGDRGVSYNKRGVQTNNESVTFIYPRNTSTVQPFNTSIWSGLENGKTSIFSRVCASGPSYQVGSQRVSDGTVFGVWNKSGVNGCSPNTTSGWRLVMNAVRGESFYLYSYASKSPLPVDSFLQRARKVKCTIHNPGTISCSLVRQSVSSLASQNTGQLVFSWSPHDTSIAEQEVGTEVPATAQTQGSEQVTMEYLLVGVDEDWRIAETGQTSATYDGLNEGTYTFRLRTTDSTGVQSIEEMQEEVPVVSTPIFIYIPLIQR
ncbi:MAG: CHAP domain-containing protein [Chloroflexaceae bacterium]|nr:CHAP domain-containing protein [Chloroflexaceae bacterium]